MNKHNIATNIAYHWFKLTDSLSDDFCKLAQFKWRQNYGVYKELRFYENSSVYYFESPEQNTGKTLFIPDITIFHKGTPAYLIEIVDTNPISKEKLNRITSFFLSQDCACHIYEIDASFVINQKELPSYIPCEKIW